MENTITWTRPKLALLQSLRDDAVKAGAESLHFEGHEILVSYAKYLIEYLETQLPK